MTIDNLLPPTPWERNRSPLIWCCSSLSGLGLPNVGEMAFVKIDYRQKIEYRGDDQMHMYCIILCQLLIRQRCSYIRTSDLPPIRTQGSTFCPDAWNKQRDSRKSKLKFSPIRARGHVLLSLKACFPARLTAATSYLVFQFAESRQTMVLSNIVICTNSL